MSLTVTDLFCGGGGSSTGLMSVPGFEIRIAANHWQLAVDVHNANHPNADHAQADLHQEDPRYFPKTDILWASPECTTWSQAGGDKYSRVPLEADLFTTLDPDLIEDPLTSDAAMRSRLLMFDVLRFAEHHRYRAMIVENVVDVAARPKYRPAWNAWKKALRNLGYDFRVVSLNSMHAQAAGLPAPQSRDRIYVVCWRRGDTPPDIEAALRPRAWCPRCDVEVEAIQAWKNGRTVGRYRQQYVYIHGACGTTVEPGWLPAAAAIDWAILGKRIGDRDKPLAEKTRRRIAAGIARYWRPFTLEAAGNTFERHPGVRTWPIEEYLRTLHTTASKAVAVPDSFIIERRGEYRIRGIDAPLSTLVANETTKALVGLPFIAELRGGGSDARSVVDPAATFCANGNHHALVTPSGGTWNEDARPVDEALRALTTRDAYALVTPYYGASEKAHPVDKPIGTLTTVDRYALVTRHNSSKGDGAEMTTPASEYLRTLTTTAQQSIVTPGDLEAAEAQVDDCLFRMLEPHEVAAGMAFPADYLWDGTRRERVKLAGNAVTPPAARDLGACLMEALS